MRWWKRLNTWMKWRGIGWRDIIMLTACLGFIVAVVSLAIASIFA